MENKLKTFTSAPLPFQGQKRRHAKEFQRIIRTLQPDVVVDLFGGSGLLAHLAKRACPKSRVIYNDYDNYCGRLAHIPQTNELLCHFRELLTGHRDNAKIEGKLRTAILQKLSAENSKGYVDWITLSSSLMFSMKYAVSYDEFEKQTLYCKVKMTDYNADGYLDGLEVVKADYRELCCQYGDTPRTLFIADPPYLSTDVSTYNAVGYWTLKNYLNVLSELKELNFIYFTSEKSQITELCEWIDDNEDKVRNIFKGASVSTVISTTSGTNSYTDIMLYNLSLK